MLLILLLLAWCSVLGIEGSSTVGLKNAGNTCYANTALQGIASLPEAVAIIMKADGTKLVSEAHRKLLLRLQTVLYAMRNGDELSRDYLHAFWSEVAAEIGWSSIIFTQQDSLSFYQCFNKAIAEKLLFEEEQREHFASIYAFSVAIQNRQMGNEISEIHELSIQLLASASMLANPGASPSLDQSFLANFSFMPHMEDKKREGRSFPACAPSVLLVEIGRRNSDLSKNLTPVEFPTKFDLAKYMEVADDKKDFGDRCKKKKNDTDKIFYKLCFITVHSGSGIESGHYYGYRRETNDQWFQLNDSSVASATEYEAVGSTFGGTASARSLAYVREDEIDRVLKSKVEIPYATMKAIEQELASMKGTSSGTTKSSKSSSSSASSSSTKGSSSSAGSSSSIGSSSSASSSSSAGSSSTKGSDPQSSASLDTIDPTVKDGPLHPSSNDFSIPDVKETDILFQAGGFFSTVFKNQRVILIAVFAPIVVASIGVAIAVYIAKRRAPKLGARNARRSE